jgi:hypothetical protein
MSSDKREYQSRFSICVSFLLCTTSPNFVSFLVISARNTAAGDRGGLFGAGGRFKGGVDPIMEKFNESIHFDKR